MEITRLTASSMVLHRWEGSKGIVIALLAHVGRTVLPCRKGIMHIGAVLGSFLVTLLLKPYFMATALSRLRSYSDALADGFEQQDLHRFFQNIAGLLQKRPQVGHAKVLL